MLRWKSRSTSSRRGAGASSQPTQPSASEAFAEPSLGGSWVSEREQVQPASSQLASHSNPLRGDRQQMIRHVSYTQQDSAADAFEDPFDDDQSPQPGRNDARGDQLPRFDDELQGPEPAPIPKAQPELKPGANANEQPAAPPQEERSPRDLDDIPRPAFPPQTEDEQRRPLQAPERLPRSDAISCNELRNQARNRPISEISLDVSPAYGAGLRTLRQDTEPLRLDFAANSEVRRWTNTRGEFITSGRMIDLRFGQVVLDVDGREEMISLRDLSDVDTAYVGESWNLPLECGYGYERYADRSFIPSEVQWKASGLSHKPLYFEQVQLERYGHDAGPIVQPLISSAHFFTNIGLLPYKMGIHPPHECQYSLGYYRPGNCAPYMVQPIPWSLRGAAAEAGAVIGGAALVP